METLPRASVDIFALRLVLSFVIGGGSVAAFTAIAETRGSRVGGLLLSFPVKVVISLVLIALNEGVAFAATSAAAVPAGIAVNCVFLLGTALLVRRLRPWPAILGALAAWLLVGVAVVLLAPANFVVTMALYVVVATTGLVILSRIPTLRGDRRGKEQKEKLTPLRLLVRAGGAGTVVALSVVLAHVAGPLIGGLASVFPSGFITTMVILTRKHGADFTGATARVMIAGSAAPALFGVAVAVFYPKEGILVGTLLAMLLALAVSLSVATILARADGLLVEPARVVPSAGQQP